MNRRAILIRTEDADGQEILKLARAGCIRAGLEPIEAAEVSAIGPIIGQELGLLVIDDHLEELDEIKKLLAAQLSTPCLWLVSRTDLPESIAALVAERCARTVMMGRKAPTADISEALEQLVEDASPKLDKDFLRVSARRLSISAPPNLDLYIKLGADHYVRRFTRGAPETRAGIPEFFEQGKIEHFYIYQGSDESLEEGQARTAAIETLDVIHDVVSRVGFSEDVERLAQKAVMLILKGMGVSPDLSRILGRLKAQRGKYVASHSLMLAEISSAIAFRVGLGNAATFMKLTFAAVIHDLPLHDNLLAQVQRIDELENGSWTAEQMKSYRNHPIEAADFARKLREIPADVDTIILQHHERPDGLGFPSGLHHERLPLLSSIHIVAHELLCFLLAESPHGTQVSTLDAFTQDRKLRVGLGHYSEIISSLESGQPIV